MKRTKACESKRVKTEEAHTIITRSCKKEVTKANDVKSNDVIKYTDDVKNTDDSDEKEDVNVDDVTKNGDNDTTKMKIGDVDKSCEKKERIKKEGDGGDEMKEDAACDDDGGMMGEC